VVTANSGSQSVQRARERATVRRGEPAFAMLDFGINNCRYLADMDGAIRGAHPCIGTLWTNLVIHGCAILDTICHLWPAQRLQMAGRGLREKILLDLMDNHTDNQSDGIVVATGQAADRTADRTANQDAGPEA
jgi:exopolyphosphatase/pppGpp-phosphohydrolase